MKRNGDRGSSCLRPSCGLKWSKGHLFRSIEKDIHYTHRLEKPKHWSTCKWPFSLSYAFFISNFNPIHHSFVFESHWMNNLLSQNNCLSLLARIFDIILYKTLQREIGRNWFNVDGFGTLGMRAMKELLICLTWSLL